MGFYQDLFNKTWLVTAHNVWGNNTSYGEVRALLKAPTAEEAKTKLENHLKHEGFTYARVDAAFG